ncbi:MAG: hypothetical protein IM631_12745 [Cytophagales bacterium]|nr:hypothetical protein [Cytophagales bacterium]MCA6372240.1 hypothetical protein [Cytophagales bacterium]MCA6382384.1 hypothetical protein [Cytophagales bacterium]
MASKIKSRSELKSALGLNTNKYGLFTSFRQLVEGFSDIQLQTFRVFCIDTFYTISNKAYRVTADFLKTKGGVEESLLEFIILNNIDFRTISSVGITTEQELIDFKKVLFSYAKYLTKLSGTDESLEYLAVHCGIISYKANTTLKAHKEVIHSHDGSVRVFKVLELLEPLDNDCGDIFKFHYTTPSDTRTIEFAHFIYARGLTGKNVSTSLKKCNQKVKQDSFILFNFPVSRFDRYGILTTEDISKIDDTYAAKINKMDCVSLTREFYIMVFEYYFEQTKRLNNQS